MRRGCLALTFILEPECLRLSGPLPVLIRRPSGVASMGHVYYGKCIDMSTVTVSPKFQVVIPQAVRERFRLAVGERLRVVPYGDRIELIPVRPMKSMRGFLRGMDSTIAREDDRL